MLYKLNCFDNLETHLIDGDGDYMKLQKGKFLVGNISDLENILPDSDGIKRVIALAYMGKVEYEGNAIPISRMFIEYYIDEFILSY